ncbi:MAG: hypothetical protein AAF664_11700 [Planctomycetota bacterium]
MRKFQLSLRMILLLAVIPAVVLAWRKPFQPKAMISPEGVLGGSKHGDADFVLMLENRGVLPIWYEGLPDSVEHFHFTYNPSSTSKSGSSIRYDTGIYRLNQGERVAIRVPHRYRVIAITVSTTVYDWRGRSAEVTSKELDIEFQGTQ